MKPIVRVSILSGCIFGAVLGLAVSFSLDFMMSSASEGGWYESVQHDVALLLGSEWAAKSWFIYSGVVGVIGLISLIGGALGAVCGAVIGKFFSLISSS